jgi:hypothetical protein
MLLASAYDQSRYFKAADMPTAKKLRIKNVTPEEIGQDKEKKLVVWFTNDLRGLVLNKTNNRTLRGAFGDPCAGWKGKIIVVYPTTDEFRGVPALRVRIPPPKEGNEQAVAAKPKPPVPPPDAELLDDELNDDLNF